MRNSQHRSAAFLIAGLLFIGLFPVNSCKDDNATNANVNSGAAKSAADNANPVKDDVTELAQIIHLPEMPEEAVWREEVLGSSEQTPDTTGRKMTAVLRYSAENAAKITAAAEKIKPAEPSEIGTEDWFPEELTAQTQISGNESLKAFSYGAGDFLNPPYSKGKLSRIDQTNYFVLELTSF